MTLLGLGRVRLGLTLVALGSMLASSQQFAQQDASCQLVDSTDNGAWHRGLADIADIADVTTYDVPAAQQQAPATDGYVRSAGYVVKKAQKSGDRVVLELGVSDANKDTTYGANVKQLVVEVVPSGENTIRVKIADKSSQRWEVPTTLYSKGDLGKGDSAQQQSHGGWGGARSNLAFSYSKNPFSFKVTRKSDGYVLFDTSKLALVFKDQYLQVSTAVGNDLSIFGLGESTRDSLKIAPGDKHTLWARDQFSNERVNNLYGAHPFYLGLNARGKAHGVLLLNSNGMDVTLENDKLVYQVIGGVLDFHIVSGPTPADVVAQYTSLIGRPKLQPYWAYGFHQSRWGYRSVAMLREVVDNYAAAKLPLDVLWSDIDHMNKFYDFTLDPVNFTVPDVQRLLKDVHANGQKFVPIIDPGIPDDPTDYAYSRGLELDVFIKDTAGKPYLGQVWPGPTVFPDFFHPKAEAYWEEQIAKFHKTVDFDGIWLDMNELANFCPGNTCARKANTTCPLTGSIANIVTCCLACVDDLNKWDHPPFAISNVQTKEPLFRKGISTSALQHGDVRQYNAHNLYGFSESIVTANAQEKLLGKRAFTLSRSTFPGSGAYVAHWTGDNGATWDDIKWSVPAILNFGLYGIPMVGADICGFLGDTVEELCARWTALGAFYPFARNHNNFGQLSQEPYQWASVAAIGRKFIGLRYRLLPYFYTLGYEAHKTGLPIARPLFFEFAQDPNVHKSPALDAQFLLGSSVLVTPVLTQGATSVTGYVPAGTWYDIFSFAKVSSKGQTVTWNVALDEMPVHVRGGSILPLHQPALTSTAARSAPYDLLVALAADGSAKGKLYVDDGDDLRGEERSTLAEFRADTKFLLGTTFTIRTAQNNYRGASATKISKLVVLGVAKKPTLVLANVFTPVKAFTYNAATQALEVDLSKLNAKVTENFTLFWR